MGAPDCTCSFKISGYQSGTIVAKSDVINTCFMYRFIIASESLIFVPQCKGAVKPSNCERLNLWVPLNLRDLGFAALDLEVGNDNPFFADKDNSWEVSCDCEDNVEVIVRP